MRLDLSKMQQDVNVQGLNPGSQTTKMNNIYNDDNKTKLSGGKNSLLNSQQSNKNQQ